MKNKKTYSQIGNSIRRKILQISNAAQVGHISSGLSIVEIVVALYFGILRFPKKQKSVLCKDSFILSKGHAASALYAVLHEKGMLSDKELSTYCKNDTLLGEHPSHKLRGVEVTSGSLGHGLSIGVGMAMAAKIKKQKKNVYVLISDAECDEGEVWEAALSAHQHHLDNLYIYIDYNKVQAFGTTKEIVDLEPFTEKWKAFSWFVCEVDGHDVQALLAARKKAEKEKRPTVFICHTVRGKGISFMEHCIDWRYKTTNPEEFKKAMEEVAD
jgi:transketolase